MLNMNRVTLHAGRDPDIRTLKGGGRAASFSLATTQMWKDRGGDEATEWHCVVVYGPTVVENPLRKGAAVLSRGGSPPAATATGTSGASPRSSSPGHRAW